MSNSSANAETLVQKYLSLLNEQKFLDILDLAHPGATWWNSGLKEQNPYAGTKSFEDRVKGIPAALGTHKLVVKKVDLIVDAKGDKAVLETLSEVETYSSQQIMVICFKDGKIQEVREYHDFYPAQKAMKESGLFKVDV